MDSAANSALTWSNLSSARTLFSIKSILVLIILVVLSGAEDARAVTCDEPLRIQNRISDDNIGVQALNCGPELPSTPSMPMWITVPSIDEDGTFDVSWAQSIGGTRYELSRSNTTSNFWAIVQNSSALSYTTSSLPEGSYEFRVRACNNLNACSSY